MNYCDELKNIEFYKSHPTYMPFIGDKYDQFKILHIGESHYLPQDQQEYFGIDQMAEHWWDGYRDLDEAQTESSGSKKWIGWYHTSNVVRDYMSDSRTRSHGIFTEMVKVFSEACLQEPISSISEAQSKKYNYFAFMNFFQMPALCRGMSYWPALVRSARNSGLSRKEARQLAGKVWDDTVARSAELVNQVIDVLKPEIVIFTSRSAAKAYIKYGKIHPGKIIYTVHPGCKYWHKPVSSQIGKAALLEKLQAHYTSK